MKANEKSDGNIINIEFKKGKSHNHPTFAFWIENMNEEFVQTLFVTKYLATGVFGHGDAGNGEWMKNPGEAERPAALPYWMHKRNIKNEKGTLIPTKKNPVPDAYTGATPEGNYKLKLKTDKKIKGKFRILMEINQPWDFNEHWNSNKHHDKKHYKSSCQPSIIYAVTVDTENLRDEYFLNPIGHGHFNGDNGILYTNISSLTTALEIVDYVKISFKK